MRHTIGSGLRLLSLIGGGAAAICALGIWGSIGVHADSQPLQRLVFASTGITPGVTQVASGNIDGTGIINLSASTFTDTVPRVSPDGKLVAFDRAPANLQTQVVEVMGIDGKGQAPVTDSSGIAGSPSWYPDGTHLAYSAAGQIWRIKVDGTGKQQLTQGSAVKTSPSVSSDGSQLAYAVQGQHSTTLPNGTTVTATSVAIHIASAIDGSNDVALTDGTHVDLNPVFGPSGTLFFDRGEDKPPSMIFSVATTGPARVETVVTNGAQPSYDPQGNRIAFTADVGGHFGLGIDDLATKRVSTVSAFPGDSFSFTLLAAPPATVTTPGAQTGITVGPPGPPAATAVATSSGVSTLTVGLGVVGVLLCAGGAAAFARMRSDRPDIPIETIVRDVIAADGAITRDKGALGASHASDIG